MPSPTNFYADFGKLTELKGSARTQSPQALNEAARQFESLFTQMMLKSMRQASDSMPSGNSMMDNDQSKMYLEMFDNQLASQLSKGRGLGLADMLTKQLAQSGIASDKPAVNLPKQINLKTDASSSPQEAVDKLLPLQKHETKMPMAITPWKSVGLPIRLPARPKHDAAEVQAPGASLAKSESVAHATVSNDLSKALLLQNQQVNPMHSAAPLWTQVSSVTELGADSEFRVQSVLSDSDANILADRLAVKDALSKKPESPLTKADAKKYDVPMGEAPKAEAKNVEPLARSAADFVKQLWPHAQKAAKELGVDAKTLIAHAALETGWGKFVPCNPDGSCSFNLFGIKATGKWTGGSTAVNTLEYEGGIAVKKSESFRTYDSPADSFRDYAALIKNSPRYSAAVGVGNDAAAFATALQQGGYATDPSYADKLTSVALRLDAMPLPKSPLKLAANPPLIVGRSASSGDET